MVNVQGELRTEIERFLWSEAAVLWNAEKYEELLAKYEVLWEKLPGDKYEYNESYLIAQDILNTAIKLNNIDKMKEWVEKIVYCDPGRGDYGEKECWVGRIAYRLGDFDKALEYFTMASEKAGGDCFEENDGEYLHFFQNNKGKKKADTVEKELFLQQEVPKEVVLEELDDHIYAKIIDLCEKGDEQLAAGMFKRALECYQVALELLPNPKNVWEAATWIYMSLGDVCFLTEQFEQAKQYFFDALNCPDALTNPFIQMRLGECLYEVGNFEKAKEYLLRAYMLEGHAVFEEEDEKYFDAIVDLI